MTVGKIYCAKLIYENYRHLKKQGKDSFKVLIFSASEVAAANRILDASTFYLAELLRMK